MNTSKDDEFHREFEMHSCGGKISVRTNGFQGGDAGHGGFIELRFEVPSAALFVSLEDEEARPAMEATVWLGGDFEIEEVTKGLHELVGKLLPYLKKSRRKPVAA